METISSVGVVLSDVIVSLPHITLMSSKGEDPVLPPSARALIVNVLFTNKSVGTVMEYPPPLSTGAEISVYGAAK